jgi:hypothetical protein
LNRASIVFILGAELPKVNGRVAEGAEVEPSLFHLLFVHFVFAPLASVIVPSHDRLPADNAGREIGPAFPAARVVLTYRVLAVATGTLHLFARGLFWSVLCEYADCHVHVFLALFSSAHALKLDKRP